MFKNLIRKDNSILLHAIGFAILVVFFNSPANEFIVITEILKNPVGGSDDIPGDKSHEFIEITNLGSDTFTVDSLFLFDNPGDVDSIVFWDTLKHGSLPMHANCIFNCRILLPGKSALVMDPDYEAAVTINPSSNFRIDSGTSVWTIDDNSIGNGGLSESDGIALFKGTKKSINRVVGFVSDRCGTFTLNDTIRQILPQPSEGTSLVPGSILFCPPSFSSCPTTLSPGHYEKIKNNWLTEWRCSFSTADSTHALCSLAVVKVGSQTSSEASWSIVRSLLQTSSIVKQGVFGTSPLPMKLSSELSLDSASYQFKVYENSQGLVWNIDLSSLWTPPYAIKINEIFPRAQTDAPEWFELVNISTMPVTVRNWLYGNFESSCPVTQDDIIIQPGAYLVVTKDKRLFSVKYPSISCVCQPEAWLSLDNSKDTLCLWNSRGSRCETIFYNAGWFDRWTDQSIERVSLHHDPTSRGAWVLAERPSPGQPNGSVPFREAEKPGLEIGPERFTPNGDGRDDLLSIRLTLPATYTAAISVYGFNGRKFVDVPTLSSPPYYWNGKTSANTPAPTGPFFVVATFKNGSQTVMIRKKGILWR